MLSVFVCVQKRQSIINFFPITLMTATIFILIHDRRAHIVLRLSNLCTAQPCADACALRMLTGNVVRFAKEAHTVSCSRERRKQGLRIRRNSLIIIPRVAMKGILPTEHAGA